MRLDIHQHIWTDPLLAALSARRELPLVRHRDGSTVLLCASEQPYVVDVAAEAAGNRAALVRRDGLDRALIALSSPIGIEALPRDGSLSLIDAYLDGVAGLPSEFAAWGPVALDGADVDQVDRLLARGCVGISLAAGALARPDQLERVGPILERVSSCQVPLFVHPGPAPGDRPATPLRTEPPWWRALTDYVAQMQAAWLTFTSFGRREHPEIVTIFAMLAGGAPLLSERLEARSGPQIDLRDPRVFYDTSSYGPAAIEMMSRRVGEGQLLYGSDRPVAEPIEHSHVELLQTNGVPLFPTLAAAA